MPALLYTNSKAAVEGDMADIFISYSKQDPQHTKALADDLEGMATALGGI